MKIRRDPTDAAFSDFIRERDNWTCQRCGTPFPPERRMGLHCSHFWSRRHQATRFDPINCDALCYGCHSFMGNGENWSRIYVPWKIARIGKDQYDRLDVRAHSIVKFAAWDKEILRQSFREEIKLIKFRRLAG